MGFDVTGDLLTLFEKSSLKHLTGASLSAISSACNSTELRAAKGSKLDLGDHH
jgi:hypothetical protein